jgi:hypothetical protein
MVRVTDKVRIRVRVGSTLTASRCRWVRVRVRVRVGSTLTASRCRWALSVHKRCSIQLKVAAAR